MNITATLFGQMITFAVLVFFVNKFLWDPLTNAMAERSKRIADGLAAAEHGKEQERLAQKKATSIIREARREKDQIIAAAQQRGSEIIEHARHEADKEKRRRIKASAAEIAREYNQAREKLRHDMNGLIIEGAGRVLKSEIDLGVHNDLIDELTAKL
jgi:F-type H+-transporting ATPase subunit b